MNLVYCVVQIQLIFVFTEKTKYYVEMAENFYFKDFTSDAFYPRAKSTFSITW